MFNKLIFLGITSLLVSCVTTPDFDTSLVDRSITPSSAINKNNATLGKSVIWGGTILDIRNLKDITQIEILAYPLSSSHRPLLEKKPSGRFIIKQTGYLEASNYAAGKQLSVLGKISGQQSGKIGESSYTYPVIKC